MRSWIAVLAWACLLLAGCLRVGPGEDLHLVCEEKSASPRKAYGIELLVAQTRVDEGVPEARRLALLEAARQHVVTPGGRAHAGFEARLETLRPVEGDGVSWRFRAAGVWDEGPPDLYSVLLRDEGGRVVAGAEAPNPGPVAAPGSLARPAWAAWNATEQAVTDPAKKPTLEWAAWDPDLPSCVRVHVVHVDGAQTAVVNVVQDRVVSIA